MKQSGHIPKNTVLCKEGIVCEGVGGCVFLGGGERERERERERESTDASHAAGRDGS